MQHLDRKITEQIIQSLKPNKVIVILGSRRTGKTELLKHIINLVDEELLLLNGDDFSTHDLLLPVTIENYLMVFSRTKFLVIDEAQKVPQIGQKLKLIVDNITDIKILVTGSSAFDLTNKLGEPLTGRKVTFYLFPLAQMEYTKYENVLETKNRLHIRLVYGNYPELLQYKTKQEKSEYLYELTNSFLLKDILEFDGIKNAGKIRDLLRLISFQIGSEVSLNELGKQLGLHKDTVAKYLDLLSKVFIIYEVRGFSKNLRKEISKMSRWYFYDNGIRNVLINNLNDIEIRNDTGQLWENYIISERIKYQNYTKMLGSNYFWRTYQQQEIDWIEERDGKLFAYEMKWNDKKKVTVPVSWKQSYPEAEFNVVHPKNYLTWIDVF